MKKSDLKEGMIVEIRDGDRFVVRYVNDEVCLSGKAYWLDLTNGYTSDLKYYSDSSLDIVKVYSSHSYVLRSLFEDNELNVIWSRPNNVDYNKVPKWTKVQVRDKNSEEWKNRYFLGCDGKWFLATGRDKFSYEEDCFSQYEQCRIHSSVEIKKEWYKKN